MRSALLVHLRPGYPRHARPEGEVRRDHLSPRHVESSDPDQRRPQAPARRRLRLRRPGPVQVHRADPEPRGCRRVGRYPRRPGLRGAGPPEDVRGERRRLRPDHGERRSARGARHGRARHDRRDAPASGQWVRPPRGGAGQTEPDRLRLRRHGRALLQPGPGLPPLADRGRRLRPGRGRRAGWRERRRGRRAAGRRPTPTSRRAARSASSSASRSWSPPSASSTSTPRCASSSPARSCPPRMWPRVVLRWSDEKDLWVSGMLAGGSELAGTPAVIDVPAREGPRRPLRQQPDVEARDPRQLHAPAQHGPPLRPPARRPDRARIRRAHRPAIHHPAVPGDDGGQRPVVLARRLARPLHVRRLGHPQRLHRPLRGRYGDAADPVDHRLDLRGLVLPQGRANPLHTRPRGRREQSPLRPRPEGRYRPDPRREAQGHLLRLVARRLLVQRPDQRARPAVLRRLPLRCRETRTDLDLQGHGGLSGRRRLRRWPMGGARQAEDDRRRRHLCLGHPGGPDDPPDAPQGRPPSTAPPSSTPTRNGSTT